MDGDGTSLYHAGEVVGLADQFQEKAGRAAGTAARGSHRRAVIGLSQQVD